MQPGTKVVDIMTENSNTRRRQQHQKNNSTNETDDDGNDPLVVSVEFPTMMHGWVSLGDPTDGNVAEEQKRALEMTVKFIQAHAR